MEHTPEQLEATKRRLKRLTEQLRESLSELSALTDSKADFSIKLPFLDLECKFKRRRKHKHPHKPPHRPPHRPPCPDYSASVRGFLEENTGRVVRLTIPNELFSPLEGTILSVEDDYVVLLENTTGVQNLVRLNKIEAASLVR
ncbi:hypothetical protein [Metabacillus fastidiosus]|uniref:hypothetical protein n=1 Tax=Metabacillus fastidiosus TaxID=1458 RepID=UPI003D28A3AC